MGKRKYKFVFIATRPGEEFGRLVRHGTLERARLSRREYKVRGWKVSRISKTTKV